ncbi:hypothetical protein PP175_29125 (plasmid) [Aneurinibacillus sp. Ricciae_BoGa-3]|uniref:hypothetical protein n=1 Tax=Aneurinibacillus sp. Ricciae_BoGa-3 TaxID=3022697 RepID=UPI0023419959|nr:hypothetical protein [Aneurinibacillus sp. Ricciae_BoGa-3]WCK57255.1 hypothetical protein PP175_29125 [Aneurinibacillus sp. Ricciae_BoGa-3]
MMPDLKEIAFRKRKSIKRAIARFCYLKNIDISPDEFEAWVRRTQDSGYNSSIRFFALYLEKKGTPLKEKRQLLLQFTIEYNTEMYCKQFPNANQSVERILSGERLPEDESFFKQYVYDIVKANKLQLQVIESYV